LETLSLRVAIRLSCPFSARIFLSNGSGQDSNEFWIHSIRDFAGLAGQNFSLDAPTIKQTIWLASFECAREKETNIFNRRFIAQEL
jgi:hypothetical protein